MRECDIIRIVIKDDLIKYMIKYDVIKFIQNSGFIALTE